MKNQRKTYVALLIGVIAVALATLAGCRSPKPLNAEADILEVKVDGVTLLEKPTITNKEVKLMVKRGEDITAITPHFTLSQGATINPASGVVQDFTNPVTYTVTAENKTNSKEYKVSVLLVGKEPQPANSEANILEVRIEGVELVKEPVITDTEVKLTVEKGNDITAVVPHFTLSEGATISPASGVAQDLTNPVIYTVTAENKTSTKEYTLSVELKEKGTVPQNNEANILGVRIEGATLAEEAEITDNAVKLVVNKGDALTAITPYFTLSPGATINPASGVVQDFTSPVTYTVTAENKTDSKQYTVSVSIKENGGGVPEEGKQVTFSFEDSRLGESKFYVFTYKGLDGFVDGEWASSNLGYMLTGQAKKPADFPVAQDDNGYKGKCAKLTTLSTGALGKMFKAPLATGSMFLGELDRSTLAIKPLESTKFGVAFFDKPLKLSGYYKYTAGKEFEEMGEKVAGKKDACDIYAVLFETSDAVPHLNGTNSLTSENIVLMARLKDAGEVSQWTHFEIPFEAMNGKEVDKAKLAAGKYKFAIVASSSIGGAKHHGAVGSTLYLDELTVHLAK